MKILSAMLCVSVCTSEAYGQQDLNSWLNARIDSVVAVRVSVRSSSKQPLIPVGSASDATLVDRANMPDISGVSIKLPNEPASTSDTHGAASAISLTPYALWGIIQGSPLDPTRYMKLRSLRRVGFSAAFDTDSTGKTSALVQFKVVVIDRGTALDVDGGGAIRSRLKRATRGFDTIQEFVDSLLFETVGTRRSQSRDDFSNSLAQGGGFAGVLAEAGPDVLNAIDAFITQNIDAFVSLRSIVDSLQTATNSRPEFAIGLTSTNAGLEPSSLRAIAILDVGRGRYDLTFNAGYQHVRANETTGDQDRVVAAAQFLWRMTPEDRLTGRSPITLTLAASAAADVNELSDGLAKVQLRLMLPLAEGVNVPLSATWASKTDLIDESNIRGQIGFTFNITQLLDAIN